MKNIQKLLKNANYYYYQQANSQASLTRLNGHAN